VAQKGQDTLNHRVIGVNFPDLGLILLMSEEGESVHHIVHKSWLMVSLAMSSGHVYLYLGVLS
jgi:uncharacterized membrane protein